jgi:hypothetical protein
MEPAPRDEWKDRTKQSVDDATNSIPFFRKILEKWLGASKELGPGKPSQKPSDQLQEIERDPNDPDNDDWRPSNPFRPKPPVKRQ